jgi:hypothetical protein
LPTPGPTPLDLGSSSFFRAQSVTRPPSLPPSPSSPHSPTWDNSKSYAANPFANAAPMQQLPPPSNGVHFQSYSQPQLHDGNMLQMAMNAIGQVPDPHSQAVSQNDMNRFLATMMDIFRSTVNPMQGQIWGGQMPMSMSQGQMNLQQPMFGPQHQLNSMQPPMGMDPQLQATHLHTLSPSKNATMQHEGSPSPSQDSSEDLPSKVLPASTRRRTSISRRSSLSKGTQRSNTPDPPESSLVMESSSQSPSTFSSPSPQPLKGEPRKPGRIFISASGESLVFFVQIDIRNRSLIIKKIKVWKSGQ